MSARARGWLSPAAVIALFALFVSLTGGAVATVIITSNSQVAAHTIAGAKAAAGVNQNIMPGTIGGSDIANGAIGSTNMAAPKWFTLTLLNGWSGAPFGTGMPAVALDAQGFVHLRGAMNEGGAFFNAAAFVLPAAFWPSHTVFVTVDTVEATTGRLQIGTNGTVLVQDINNGGNAKVFTSLDGVTFAR